MIVYLGDEELAENRRITLLDVIGGGFLGF